MKSFSRSTPWFSCLVTLALGVSSRAQTGGFERVDATGPIAHPAGAHRMFSNWGYVAGGPVVCRFERLSQPDYQVFIGLIEAHWDRPGQRLVDIEIGGTVVSTVDTFNGAQGKPHGYVFPAKPDAGAQLVVRIRSNPKSPDQNPAVCGILLFGGDPPVNVEAVIADQGPKPLVEALVTELSGPFWRGRGGYFAKKAYVPAPLPQFDKVRGQLPSPIFDEDPSYVRMYWKAWELAFRNFYEPPPKSGFVSPFIDAAFNANIFQWDTCFMTMFCNYAHAYVPGICSLDNFYCKQFENGEISREIVRASGREYEAWIDHEGLGLRSTGGFGAGKGNVLIPYIGRQPPQPPPHLTLDGLDHPIFAWAEMESYRLTGDKKRLELVYEPLVHYFRALHKYLRQGNGLYLTDWASMDNSPRNPYLRQGGCAVDASCEMVLFARDLSAMAAILGKGEDSSAFQTEASNLSRLINELMWDPSRQFYFDLTADGRRAPVKTCAAFWALLAGVAGPVQIDALAEELRNPKTFARLHRVPTLSADEKEYQREGGYWKGSVWAPINTVVIRGLERCRKPELAREIANNHLRLMAQVFKETGTIWENYAPDAAKPGSMSARDFVGWSGIGPILYLIEDAIGIYADAPANTLTWTLRSLQRVGIERLRFGDKTVSLICEAPGADGVRLVRVTADGPMGLTVLWNGQSHSIPVKSGQIEFKLRNQ